jgi:hypothetical protein
MVVVEKREHTQAQLEWARQRQAARDGGGSDDQGSSQPPTATSMTPDSAMAQQHEDELGLRQLVAELGGGCCCTHRILSSPDPATSQPARVERQAAVLVAPAVGPPPLTRARRADRCAYCRRAGAAGAARDALLGLLAAREGEPGAAPAGDGAPRARCGAYLAPPLFQRLFQRLSQRLCPSRRSPNAFSSAERRHARSSCAGGAGAGRADEALMASPLRNVSATSCALLSGRVPCASWAVSCAPGHARGCARPETRRRRRCVARAAGRAEQTLHRTRPGIRPRLGPTTHFTHFTHFTRPPSGLSRPVCAAGRAARRARGGERAQAGADLRPRRDAAADAVRRRRRGRRRRDVDARAVRWPRCIAERAHAMMACDEGEDVSQKPAQLTKAPPPN